MFPSFAFVTTRENSANPFDLQLLRSVRFSRPVRGEFLAANPLSALVYRASIASTIYTPRLAIAAVRIKAINRSRNEKLALRTVR
jgi:hypothetical protein